MWEGWKTKTLRSYSFTIARVGTNTSEGTKGGAGPKPVLRTSKKPWKSSGTKKLTSPAPSTDRSGESGAWQAGSSLEQARTTVSMRGEFELASITDNVTVTRAPVTSGGWLKQPQVGSADPPPEPPEPPPEP